MKVLLVSDTHGKEGALKEAVKIEAPELLLHMGDVEGSEELINSMAGCPVVMVSGNNDFFSDLNPEEEISLKGHKIFMTHGHYYYVSMGTERLKEEGRSRGADLVFFGHTHRPLIDREIDIIVANPGSLAYPRQEGRRPSYVVMNIERDCEPELEIKYL